MKLTRTSRWICENVKNLEKCSGQWVAFNTREGIVSKGKTLKHVLSAVNKRPHPIGKPFVFHVPSEDELKSPLAGIK